LAATNEPTQRLRQFLRIAATQILQHIGEAAARAQADDRRRRQRQYQSAPNLAEFRGDPGEDPSDRIRRALAFFERFQRDDHERRIRRRVIVDEIQSDDRGIIDNRVLLLDDILRLFDHV
jgi:hypothetical protein